MSKKVVDISTLDPEARKRVEKALNRRDTQFGSRFRKEDVAAWHRAAEAKEENITDWVERNLNDAARRNR